MSVLVRYERLPALNFRAASLLGALDRLRAAFASSRNELELVLQQPNMVRDLGLERLRERANAHERAASHANFASHALGVRAGPLR